MLYLLGGVLRYRQGELQITVPLAPATITVLPSPSLAVEVLPHQRDVFADDPFTVPVEPSVPFSLAVMVANKGHGPAHNVRIAWPNPRSLRTKKACSSTSASSPPRSPVVPLEPSLNVEFGEIPAGTNAIGRWLLTSSLLGGFIEYAATFEHQDSLGDQHLLPSGRQRNP